MKPNRAGMDEGENFGQSVERANHGKVVARTTTMNRIAGRPRGQAGYSWDYTMAWAASRGAVRLRPEAQQPTAKAGRQGEQARPDRVRRIHRQGALELSTDGTPARRA